LSAANSSASRWNRASQSGSVAKAAGNVLLRDENLVPAAHWQGREVTVVSQPAQAIQADGEVLPAGCVTVRIIPGAVRFVVPGDNAG